MKFSDFNFQPELLQALNEMGYEAPTPIQAQTIPLLLKSQDVIGCARTGSGKTAAFALPVLDRIKGGGKNPQALIIAPTRELAEQIRIAVDDFAKHLPIKSLAIYGGASSRLQEQALGKGVDIVIATPGRLLDLLQRSIVRLYSVKYLIMDEADRMLDMGFVPDIEEIITFLPKKRQTLLFSATMPDAIKKLAFSLTQDAEMIRIGVENAASESVKQSVVFLQSDKKAAALLNIIKTQDVESMIVFARTKTGADQVARELIQNHVNATCIHSNRSQSQRQSALKAFRNGEYQVLVATDVAARGIDVSSISHVINYDTPTHAEDYVHRVGRTGRAGSKGVAFTFTSTSEKKYLKDIEKLIGKSIPVDNLTPLSAPEKPQAPPIEKATAKKSTAKKPAAKKTAAKKAVAKTKAPRAKKAAEKKALPPIDAEAPIIESKKPKQVEKTPLVKKASKKPPKKVTTKKAAAKRVKSTPEKTEKTPHREAPLRPVISKQHNGVTIGELPTPRFTPKNKEFSGRKVRKTYSLIQADARISESHAFYRNPEDELDYLEFKPSERPQEEEPSTTRAYRQGGGGRQQRRSHNNSSRNQNNSGRGRQSSRRRTR